MKSHFVSNQQPENIVKPKIRSFFFYCAQPNSDLALSIQTRSLRQLSPVLLGSRIESKLSTGI